MLRFLQRSCITLALLTLASCTMPGQPVAGIPGDGAWYSLNFDEMLHEGDAQPEALSFCGAPDCPRRLVVGAIIVTGASAATLENLLHNPALLATELKRREREPTLKRAAKAGSKQHIQTMTSVAPLKDASADGFTISMRRKDGKGHIEAAVLGWREGEKLRVIIAIGDDADAVKEVALRAAEQYMKAAGVHAVSGAG